MKSKLGLVLAGGGSLGAYQVGAIEALEKLGYKFDVVTGTSIGAINGAFVCNRQTKKLRSLWEGITPEKVMVDGLNISKREVDDTTRKSFLTDLRQWGRQYFKGGKPGADITPFKEYVKNAIDVDACIKSRIKYGVVTTTVPFLKLVDVDMHKVTKKDFLSFLHASSACFPIFPPEKIGKQTYVDGFYKDNLPIRLAFNLGADEVIALDMKLFSLEPQHSFYLSFPNVTYIAPYIKLGSMMDFSQEVISKNMTLGYLDVMKHYKKLYGFQYAFKPFEIDRKFMSFILNEYETDAKYIIEELSRDIRTPMSVDDYFIRTLEIIADRAELYDYYQVYDIVDFKMLVQNKVEVFVATEKNKLQAIKKASQRSLYKAKSVFVNYLLKFLKKYLDTDIEEISDMEPQIIEEKLAIAE